MNVSILVARSFLNFRSQQGREISEFRLTSLRVSLCLCYFSLTHFTNISPPRPPEAIPVVWEFYTLHITIFKLLVG